jgi:putative NADH-flavin reductase
VKLVVFGATGGTGKQVVERALATGHDVTAVARKPDAIVTKHDRLRVVKGDVLDGASVAAAIAGADAVVSAFGPANNKQPGTLMSDGVANLVRACEQAGVKRFVFESGLMAGDGTGLSWFGRLGLAIYRWLYTKLAADKRIAETTIRGSALDYVIVRPPALTDGPARGTFVHGVDRRLSAAKKLAHADVAEFLIRACGDAALARTTQSIGEP